MFFESCLCLYVLGTCALKLELDSAPANEVDALSKYGLDDFVVEFERNYTKGSEEWKKREQLFHQNHARVLKLRAKRNRTWTPGITKFMDYAEGEFLQLLGYKGRRTRTLNAAAVGRHASMEPAPVPPAHAHNYTFPSLFTTATKGKKLTAFVRDQGQCGSCWAEAAIAVLEGAAETYPGLLKAMRTKAKSLKVQLETVSSQAMVACTPNPRKCGGTGGCDGATAELGFDMVMGRGLPMAGEWPYTAGSYGSAGACDEGRFATDFRLTISGYEVLPSNRFNPLLEALTRLGHPIAIAVDATNWNYYDGGIYSDMDDGEGQFIVNHEVTLMGFSMPSAHSLGYYHIKNSWGVSWGEAGFIRLEMKRDEESHCGWDTDTHIGLACDGDPDKAWVCGTCGILYDATYPTGLKEFVEPGAA